jgi:hypothetical protein
MTEADFKRLAAEGYNRVPLVPETFADLDTPLLIYLKLDTLYLKPETLGCPDLFCPDLLLLLSEEIAVVDKRTGKLHLVVFAGLPSPFTATRYHALAIARSGLPDCLEVTSHGLDRRWREHGCAPQEAGGRGRAVSPRIHTHRARPPPAG